MSGSGYITETASKPSKKSLTGYIGRADDPRRSCQGSALLFPFYRKSFRSGSAWDRYGYLQGSIRQFDESTLVENLMVAAGMDIGHEYELQQVLDIRSSFRRTGGTDSTFNDFALNGTFCYPDVPGSPSGSQVREVLKFINFSDPSSKVTDESLIAQGTRCIAQSNPLKPPVTLATSLTELVSEGLPSILGKQIFSTPSAKKTGLIKSVGGEYLNYVFGVLPIVSDIRGIVEVLQRGNDIVETWQRNDGRQVRRHRTWQGNYSRDRFDIDLSGSGGLLQGIFPDPDTKECVGNDRYSGSGSQSGFLESYRQENIQYSFAGAFEYDLSRLIPDYPEPLKSMFLSNSSTDEIVEVILQMHLVGLDPRTAVSADTVWNVLPFSWLLDWFVNIGDLVSNVTALQTSGLQLDYGYMSVVQDRRFTATFLQNHMGATVSGTASISSVRKRRIRATPFGFGSTFSSLTTGQAAILSSLATSKLK